MTASRKYNQKANIEKHTKLQIDDLELFPTVSFRFLSHNGEYNFDSLKKHKSDIACALLNKLRVICSLTWKTLQSKDKKSGFEYMSQAVLEKPILNDIDIGLVGDRKLLVFRFHSEDYRLIACRDTVDRRVLNILGIDINLTLYKHGH